MADVKKLKDEILSKLSNLLDKELELNKSAEQNDSTNAEKVEKAMTENDSTEKVEKDATAGESTEKVEKAFDSAKLVAELEKSLTGKFSDLVSKAIEEKAGKLVEETKAALEKTIAEMSETIKKLEDRLSKIEEAPTIKKSLDASINGTEPTKDNAKQEKEKSELEKKYELVAKAISLYHQQLTPEEVLAFEVNKTISPKLEELAGKLAKNL